MLEAVAASTLAQRRESWLTAENVAQQDMADAEAEFVRPELVQESSHFQRDQSNHSQRVYEAQVFAQRLLGLFFLPIHVE